MAKNNQIILMGNLTADPALREVTGSDGKAMQVANYEIGVHGANNTTTFFRIASWGKQAQNEANLLKKGNFVVVQGELQLGSYEKNGIKIPTVQVKAENVTYMMPAKEANSGKPAPAQTAAPSNEDQF